MSSSPASAYDAIIGCHHTCELAGFALAQRRRADTDATLSAVLAGRAAPASESYNGEIHDTDCRRRGVSGVDREAGVSMPALLGEGLRPFFLAAALWAGVALGLWVLMLAFGVVMPSRFDPLSWHIHEMLFGFVMAAMAGFLLTAVSSWTQRPAVRGSPLAALAGLWLLGRVACLVSAWMSPWLAITADLAFPVALVAVIAREIVAARNWRNLPMIAPVVVLAIANLLMHLASIGVAVSPGLGWRLGVAAIIVMISVVGGRIVPTFTRNWLTRRQHPGLPSPAGWVDRLALGVLHAGLFGWALWPLFAPFGLLLLLGAILNVWRLWRWRGVATCAEPLLWVLHLGYAWLAVGAGLLGASMLAVRVPETGAIHALTAGAIGTMILAVMTRATRGHTGRALSADGLTLLIYALITAAAITRVAAEFALAWFMPLLIVSAALWISAFALFLLCYGPMLVRERVRG